MQNLLRTEKMIYAPCSLFISKLVVEREGFKYAACRFELSKTKVRFCVSKITPKKPGSFATIWKREGQGAIQPFEESDDIDFFVICTNTDTHFGQFVFPKDVLGQYDFCSKEGKGGKRAIRVYAPWDVPESKQAKNTQRWQLDYFLEVSAHTPIDSRRVKMLYKKVPDVFIRS